MIANKDIQFPVAKECYITYSNCPLDISSIKQCTDFENMNEYIFSEAYECTLKIFLRKDILVTPINDNKSGYYNFELKECLKESDIVGIDCKDLSDYIRIANEKDYFVFMKGYI